MNIANADLSAKAAADAYQSGNYRSAEVLAESVLLQFPEHQEALRVAAMAAQRRGDFGTALGFALRSLERDSTDVGVLNLAGNALRVLKQFPESEEVLRQALRIAPERAETHLNLALTLLDLGLREKAATFFKNVLLLRSDSDKAHFYLGKLLLEDDRPDEAVRELKRALHIASSNNSAREMLVTGLLRTGRTQEALEESERVVSEIPDQARAKVVSARLAFELAHDFRALEHLDAALVIESGSDTGVRYKALSASLGLIDIWCEHHDARYQRVARAQWLRYGQPKVLPAQESAAFVVPPPFSRELFVASLPCARVLPKELLVLTHDGKLLVEGLMNQSYRRVHASAFVQQLADDGRVLMKVPTDTISVREPVCLLGSAGTHFSWVYECLARLWVLRQRPELNTIPLIVSGQLSKWQHVLLEQLGLVGSRVIHVPTDAMLECELLHVPAVPAVGWFIAPMAVEFLRRHFRRDVPRRSTPIRRLFLSNQGNDGRKVANEAELLPLLYRHGFERISLESIDLKDMLALLSYASVVVGVESDALAHLFVLPPGSSVGVLCTRGLQQPSYYCASAPLGLDFTYIVGEPEFGSNSELSLCDLYVSPELLGEYLAELPSRKPV